MVFGISLNLLYLVILYDFQVVLRQDKVLCLFCKFVLFSVIKCVVIVVVVIGEVRVCRLVPISDCNY